MNHAVRFTEDAEPGLQFLAVHLHGKELSLARGERDATPRLLMDTPAPITHPVFRSVNRPLRICGVERRLFLLAIGLAGAVFNLFHTLLGGLLTFALLYAIGVWATQHDPEFLRILLTSRSMRRRFDPMRYVGLHARGCPARARSRP